PEAKWIEANSYKYGYIVRYPEGKQQITGYKYEPWHIRFVGKELASKVYKKGITLEEYYNDYMQVDNLVQ
ncbi:MAG: D-alanyl-D-alanine carboxypeptidase family protein, partial [Priestia megaterium]